MKIWKPVPGYEGLDASSDGEIRFMDTGHVTKGGVSGAYRRVSVIVNRKTKERRLLYTHDLICRAFHGLPNLGEVVLHLDDDKLNCVPSNLAWGTQSENILSAYRNGLIRRRVL